MNNDKVKALFMAQYYLQKVLIGVGIDENMIVNGTMLDQALGSEYPADYLLLRTVDQLTDEEVLTIADIIHRNTTIDYASNYALKTMHINIVKRLLATGTFNYVSIYDIDILFAYLRSIAVLLPFTYLSDNHPVTLSTDEILNLGWAKIKSN